MVKQVLAALAAFFVVSAHANLVSVYSQFGVGTHIFDTSSGLRWLRLDHSLGLTDQDWAGAYANSSWNDDYSGGGREWTFQSGVYAGYSVATRSEISDLIVRYVCADTYNCGGFRWSDGEAATDPDVTARALDVIGLFGGNISTGDFGVRGSMFGTMIDSPVLGTPSYGFWMSALSGPGGTFTESDRFGSVAPATFLIAAPVPEPSTYALMLAGLGAVVWVARKRRART